MRNDHTTEERLEAVLACLEGGRALKEAAQAYQVEVQTLPELGEKVSGAGFGGAGGPEGQAPCGQTPPGAGMRPADREQPGLKKENELLKKWNCNLRKKCKSWKGWIAEAVPAGTAV